MGSLDMLDSLAKDTTKKKTNDSSIEAMPLDGTQKKLVDDYCDSKKTFQESEAVLGGFETQVKEQAGGYLENEGVSGRHKKSVSLEGTKSKVRVTLTDRFSITSGDIEDDLKNVLAEKFDKCIEKERVVKVRKEVIQNDALLDELIQKIGPNDFAKYFDVSSKLKTKKGFDKEQFNLSPDQREKIKTTITQASPGITVV